MPRKILLLEDEKNMGLTLSEHLADKDYDVIWVQNIESAKDEARRQNFDLFLLDVNLPDGSGFDFARFCKEQNFTGHFLFLSAMGEAQHRIEGLSLGADDYIVKPFHLKELMLRIENAMRRPLSPGIPRQKNWGAFQIDLDRLLISFQNQETQITSKEAKVLELLLKNQGHIVTREEMMSHAWRHSENASPRSIDNMISKLRKIFDQDPKKNLAIKSVRGMGYQLMHKNDYENPQDTP